MLARPTCLWIVVITTCLLATGSVAEAKSKATLTGTATYRERMALPAGAVLDAKLEDVSVAGPPTVIAGVRVNHPGPVPIAFAIRYDPHRINAAHMYAVRATILVSGKSLFVTDPAVRALTHGYGGDVKIVLRRAPDHGQAPPSGGGSEQAIAYNRWVPVHIGDRTVKVEAGHQEPWIELDARTRKVTGSGGCNRFNGSYEAHGDRLRFGPLAMTRMACMHMEDETAFLRALDYTRTCRVHGRTLEFMDEKGTTLVRLEERNLH
jgi:putative lipoprotein